MNDAPPPPLPEAALAYYGESADSADAARNVRRLGWICVGVGGIALVANLTLSWRYLPIHGFRTPSDPSVLGVPLFALGRMLTALLSILLILGGTDCLRRPPLASARTTLTVYAYAIVITSLSVSAFNHAYRHLNRPTGLRDLQVADLLESLTIFLGSGAASAAFPLLLLLVLRLPGIRAGFGR